MRLGGMIGGRTCHNMKAFDLAMSILVATIGYLFVCIWYEANAGLPRTDKTSFFTSFFSFRILLAHKRRFPGSRKRLAVLVCIIAAVAAVLIFAP